ncbi:hypothetical protein NHJ13734_001146 [Beauveria thailandica]
MQPSLPTSPDNTTGLKVTRRNGTGGHVNNRPVNASLLLSMRRHLEHSCGGWQVNSSLNTTPSTAPNVSRPARPGTVTCNWGMSVLVLLQTLHRGQDAQ